MNLTKIRRDFPILKTGIIYLDNAASSLTPEQVLDQMLEYYHSYRANIHRGIHQLSQKASNEYANARTKISAFINSKSEEEIILTKNTTEGINIIARGLNWRKGDRIVTTSIEHHSNFVVWLRLKERYGVDVEIVQPNKEGLFDLLDFEKAIDDQTKLVAVTHASNVLGVITPVEEITKIAHEHDALMLIDGAQSVPHMTVNVQRIGCDFLAFSGHKLCGPTGVGVLYIRDMLLNEIEPLCLGGGTVKSAGLNSYSLVQSPQRFEAGTPPIAEVIGLGAAIDYLNDIGMDKIRVHEIKLIKKLYDELFAVPKVTVYGPEPKHRVGILSFNVEGLSPHDVALALDIEAKIMVRSGDHCAIPLMKDVIHQPRGTVRASTYLYNTDEEIEKFLEMMSILSAALT
jgi:cysteine desulfurase/selenocysteine lyase